MDRSEKNNAGVPIWAMDILACPHCGEHLSFPNAKIVCNHCSTIGMVNNGILCFAVTQDDPSISWYTAFGGANFEERIKIPYTMSSLDTPVYKKYIQELLSENNDGFIVDIGAGDGRNTEGLLRVGAKHVVATDAVYESLLRLQRRLSKMNPELLENLLLIQSDVRTVPLQAESIDFVLAIEVFYYLNEDYPSALQECRRLLKKGGRALISERSKEGALMTCLLYSGIKQMLETGRTGYMMDGFGDNMLRSRCFTEQELLKILQSHGLKPIRCEGISVLSLIIGYLRGEGKIPETENVYFEEVTEFLKTYSSIAEHRRTHIVIAENFKEGFGGKSVARYSYRYEKR